MIPCKNCTSCYYGETGRGLETRLEEHKRACRIGSQYSSVAKHTLELGHIIDWKSSKIVYKENNVGRRRVVEGALINLLDVFENNKSFTQEDVFLDYLVCKSLNINLNSCCTTQTEDEVARPTNDFNLEETPE